MPFCEKCGEKLNDEQVSCPNCGAEIVPDVPVQSEESSASCESAPVLVRKKSKGKVAAIIVALVLVLVIAFVLVWFFVIRDDSGLERITSRMTPDEALDCAYGNLTTKAVNTSKNNMISLEPSSTEGTLSFDFDGVEVGDSDAAFNQIKGLFKTIKGNFAFDVNPDENEYLLDLSVTLAGMEMLKNTLTLTDEGLGVYNDNSGVYLIANDDDSFNPFVGSGIVTKQIELLTNADAMENYYLKTKDWFSELTTPDSVEVDKDVEIITTDGTKLSCDVYTLTPGEKEYTAFLNLLADTIETDEYFANYFASFGFNDSDSIRDAIDSDMQMLLETNIQVEFYVYKSEIVSLELTANLYESTIYIMLETYNNTYAGQVLVDDSLIFNFVEHVGKNGKAGTMSMEFYDESEPIIAVDMTLDFSSNNKSALGIPYGECVVEVTNGPEEFIGAKFSFTVSEDTKKGGSNHTFTIDNLVIDSVSIMGASITLHTTDAPASDSLWPTVEPKYGDFDDFGYVFSQGLSELISSMIGV